MSEREFMNSVMNTVKEAALQKPSMSVIETQQAQVSIMNILRKKWTEIAESREIQDAINDADADMLVKIASSLIQAFDNMPIITEATAKTPAMVINTTRGIILVVFGAYVACPSALPEIEATAAMITALDSIESLKKLSKDR